MSIIDVISISTIKITYVQQLLTIEQRMEKVDYCRKLCKSYPLSNYRVQRKNSIINFSKTVNLA